MYLVGANFVWNYFRSRECISPEIQDCKLLIVDEAHHAIGNHPYVQIVEKAKVPRLVGLTACFLHGKFRTPYEKKEKLQKHFRGEFWVANEEDIKDYLPEFNFDSIYFAKAAETNFEDERQRLGACINALTQMLDDLPKNLSKHWEVRLFFWKKCRMPSSRQWIMQKYHCYCPLSPWG